jgi:hypothetical protein
VFRTSLSVVKLQAVEEEAKGLLVATEVTTAAVVAEEVEVADDRLLPGSDRRGNPRKA